MHAVDGAIMLARVFNFCGILEPEAVNAVDVLVHLNQNKDKTQLTVYT